LWSVFLYIFEILQFKLSSQNFIDFITFARRCLLQFKYLFSGDLDSSTDEYRPAMDIARFKQLIRESALDQLVAASSSSCGASTAVECRLDFKLVKNRRCSHLTMSSSQINLNMILAYNGCYQ